MSAHPSLYVECRGDGPTILLVHGAGEDTGLLRPQAEALASRGFTAVSYDRRGTGRSTREGWPGGGVRSHVDDLADLVKTYGRGPTRVLGFSSGGVIALAFAATYPGLVAESIAWEPAAIGVLPDADRLHATIMAPVHAHLTEHPEDWTGAYDVMLTVISDGRADLDDPAVAAMRRNAEAAVRDDAQIITRHPFADADLAAAAAAAAAVVAVGSSTSDLHALVAGRLSDSMGRPVWTVPGADDHEIYLQQPDVLADALRSRS